MPNIEITEMTAPIPGQSLTAELGSRPWERPAKYSDPEDALEYYVKQISLPDRTAHMLEILELGYPVAPLVDSMLIAGVMQGLHTLDVAVLISPAMFKLITAVADEVGVEYKTGLTKTEDGSVDQLLVERAAAEPEAEEIEERFEETELEDVISAAKKTNTGIMSQTATQEMEV